MPWLFGCWRLALFIAGVYVCGCCSWLGNVRPTASLAGFWPLCVSGAPKFIGASVCYLCLSVYILADACLFRTVIRFGWAERRHQGSFACLGAGICLAKLVYFVCNS